MVYKNTFPLVLYSVLLILSLTQRHQNLFSTVNLKIPQKEWQSISYEQGGRSYMWSQLSHGSWALETPGGSIAVSVDEKKLLNVLNAFSAPIQLELVSHWRLDESAMQKYGLSKEMQTKITLESADSKEILYLGHKTPSGQQIYVLHKGKIYKGRLVFVFDLEPSR